ncbi:hypothetical protein [Kallipyga gabonensis]|uniref:hypothetical protein n=1 Tax=Kallipyga gabonensis TaxID=1686287 RepID=UPI0006B46C26|nr:hypothetical protein [Kallipyga gabonensis]
MKKKINTEDVKTIDTPAEGFPSGAIGGITVTLEMKNADEYKKRLKALVQCIQAVQEAMDAVEGFELKCVPKVKR